MGSHPKRLFKSIWMGYEMYQIYLNKISKLRKKQSIFGFDKSNRYKIVSFQVLQQYVLVSFKSRAKYLIMIKCVVKGCVQGMYRVKCKNNTSLK